MQVRRSDCQFPHTKTRKRHLASLRKGRTSPLWSFSCHPSVWCFIICIHTENSFVSGTLAFCKQLTKHLACIWTMNRHVGWDSFFHKGGVGRKVFGEQVGLKLSEPIAHMSRPHEITSEAEVYHTLPSAPGLADASTHDKTKDKTPFCFCTSSALPSCFKSTFDFCPNADNWEKKQTLNCFTNTWISQNHRIGWLINAVCVIYGNWAYIIHKFSIFF